MKQLKKIMHIDDDAMMRMMVQKSIERSNKGFDFISCTNATEFIENLSSFAPDLLIIDVVMPVIDGPSLLSQIREQKCTIPAIFMTGHENFELAKEGKLDPIIGIIKKPFAPASLGNDLLKLWAAYSNQ